MAFAGMDDQQLSLVGRIQKTSDVRDDRSHGLHGVALVGEIAAFFADLGEKSGRTTIFRM